MAEQEGTRTHFEVQFRVRMSARPAATWLLIDKAAFEMAFAKLMEEALWNVCRLGPAGMEGARLAVDGIGFMRDGKFTDYPEERKRRDKAGSTAASTPEKQAFGGTKDTGVEA